jgi:hypothetical protein
MRKVIKDDATYAKWLQMRDAETTPPAPGPKPE